MPGKREKIVLLILPLIIGGLLGISPHDRGDWAVELIAPALMVLACVLGHRWFCFTRLAYWLILVHVVVQLWGGHFTYGEEPVFALVKERLGLARNHYDRLAHFALGFLLFVPVREMIQRIVKTPKGWAGFFAMSIIGAIAGLWEVFEWLVVAVNPKLTEAYLGLQGDVWDPQKDIVLAFIGALLAWPLFAAWHNTQVSGIKPGLAECCPKAEEGQGQV